MDVIKLIQKKYQTNRYVHSTYWWNTYMKYLLISSLFYGSEDSYVTIF